ncbi:alpha/beta hydrolase [uncultured Shimia sp.]|uniref:alpha/beta hydrolase n=1 Tax=uncultured Shimia sp. TaxID=573152 RepID=UPI0026374FAC|nr:alpha/beta hydrolase [uncultured Shimia sp.]
MTCSQILNTQSGLKWRQLPDTHWWYGLRPAQRANAPVLLLVHGSDRDVEGMAAPFLEGNDLNVIAPLFPKDVERQDTADDYKFLSESSTDYVALLDAIRGDAQRFLNVPSTDSYLFGFSGGAQFAHRYALFRAETLCGLIVGAPGAVTLLRPDIQWWPGLAGAEQATGYPPQLAALKRLQISILVGNDDLSQGLVDRPAGSRFGSAQSGMAGATRLARCQSLAEDLAQNGCDVSFTVLPDVGHQLAPCAKAAAYDLRGWLNKKQASLSSIPNRSH